MEDLLRLNAVIFLSLGTLSIIASDDAVEVVAGTICVIMGIINIIAAFNAMGYIIKMTQ